MKWTIEFIKSEHTIYIKENGVEEVKGIGYLDPISNRLVPLLMDRFDPIHFLQMEEFSDSDEGVLFIDTKTNKRGLIVR